MSVTTRSLLPPALLAAVLLLPANIYAIGNAVGAGLRFPPLFLYQDTTYGASLIPVWREISYVTSGIIGGRSALSILLWVLGTASSSPQSSTSSPTGMKTTRRSENSSPSSSPAAPSPTSSPASPSTA